jgi:hypothetical protein
VKELLVVSVIVKSKKSRLDLRLFGRPLSEKR